MDTVQENDWTEVVRTTLADPTIPFERHWALYQAIFADRPTSEGPPIAWEPAAKTRERANVTAAMREHGHDDYASFHAWSKADRAGFWQDVIQRLGIPFHTPPATILGGPADDPVWLDGARLNIAEACFTAPPERAAIVANGEGYDAPVTWTYGELRSQADRISHALVAHGLRPGDAVALYMPMNAVCVAAYLAIVRAGMSVVSIPDSFAAGEVETRLRLGSAKAVITVGGFLRGGKRVPMAAKANEAAVAVGADCVVIDPDDETPTEATHWTDFLAQAAEAGAFEAVPCDPQDVSNILFSSGTTGEPKAIPWTHLTPIKAAMDGHFHQDIHADDVVAWPTNIGWMMGPWLIYATFVNGATMALYEGVPTSSGFLDFLRSAKVSVLGVVPAIVRAWQESGAAVPHDLPSVRVFSSTGEASNAHDYLYLMSLAGYRAPIIEYCGGTEIGGGHLTGTVVQAASPATFTTPALGLDFVLLDDDGREVGDGEMGEIFLIPPSIGLSQRLLNRDHHKEYYAGVAPGPDGQVLRRHGDQVHRLHGGFWAAGGRADDTMNLGGIKVGSVELETAMNGHPAIHETAAVAVTPDGGGAERLVVFAVLAEAGNPPDGLLRDLQARIKTRLNPLFRIHDLVIVPALPRTASNKVMRKDLRAQYGA